jgi:PAS domain S-box-containing protein
VNSQTEKLFGYPRDEILNNPIDILMPERFRHKHHTHHMGYFADPHTRLMKAGLELYGLRRGGAEFPVEINLAPLECDEGPLVMSAIRDITERKRAEEALNTAHLQLIQAEKMVIFPNIGRTFDFKQFPATRIDRNQNVCSCVSTGNCKSWFKEWLSSSQCIPACLELDFKIELTAEENPVREEAVRPTPNFMALVKDGLLGRRRLGHESSSILFNPKTFGALQTRTEAAFGEGGCFHDFKLHGWQGQW